MMKWLDSFFVRYDYPGYVWVVRPDTVIRLSSEQLGHALRTVTVLSTSGFTATAVRMMNLESVAVTWEHKDGGWVVVEELHAHGEPVYDIKRALGRFGGKSRESFYGLLLAIPADMREAMGEMGEWARKES